MSDPRLEQLERDVEIARAKLATDLSTLRAPSTYSEFTSTLKSEALEMKDTVVDKAKSSVQATIESFVEDVKARAAANPAAALAIGAGIVWQIIRRPPIASALVGAGIYSLFRTSPALPALRTTEGYLSHAKDRLGEQTSDFAASVKERAVAIGESTAEKATEFGAGIKDRATAMSEIAADKVSQLVGSAKDQTQHWSGEMRSSAHRLADNASSLVESSSTFSEGGWNAHRANGGGTQETRDNLLLGAASVAVIAALGIACQRRLLEPSESE